MAPTARTSRAVFLNVRSVVLRNGAALQEQVHPSLVGGATVVVEDGEIVCAGDCESSSVLADGTAVVDLKGGSISPGLTAFGVGVGLAHIDMEASTGDAGADAFTLGKAPTTVRHASDALVFATKNEAVGLRSGVTHAVSPPASGAVADNVWKGWNVCHALAAPHRLAPGAVLSNEAGLTITIGHTGTPISAQIALLREVLTETAGEQPNAFQSAIARITAGRAPLVIQVDNADQVRCSVPPSFPPPSWAKADTPLPPRPAADRDDPRGQGRGRGRPQVVAQGRPLRRQGGPPARARDRGCRRQRHRRPSARAAARLGLAARPPWCAADQRDRPLDAQERRRGASPLFPPRTAPHASRPHLLMPRPSPPTERRPGSARGRASVRVGRRHAPVVPRLRESAAPVDPSCTRPTTDVARPRSFRPLQAQTDSVDSPFTPLEALSLATVSLEKMLGLKVDAKRDWVASSHGGLLDVSAKVVAVSTGGEVLLF